MTVLQMQWILVGICLSLKKLPLVKLLAGFCGSLKQKIGVIMAVLHSLNMMAPAPCASVNPASPQRPILIHLSVA